MWIVRLALNRPYTFVVLSLLIVILSGVAIAQTPVDIFPDINIPVVGVIMNYSGLSPQDMQDRLATVLERNLTTTVNDIEHMEAQSYHGISVIKIFFQPGTDAFAGMAQISASSQSAVRNMPPGTVPPFMIAYSAADVPILQLGLSSKTLSELQLQDLASNFLRTQLATVQGAELPGAYGGKSRLITVDLDPQKLLQRSISGADVVDRGQRAESGRAAGNGQDRQPRIRHRPEQQRQDRGGAQRRADRGRQRRDGLPARRRLRARRRQFPDQYRAHRRPPRRVAGRAEARQGLDAGRGGPHPRRAAQDRRHAAARAGDHAVERSIDLRPGRRERRAARSDHRRRPDGGVDSAVSRQLAQHAGGVHFHPAVHSHVAADDERARRDAQHHDPGRPGAGGRHPGGRRHRGNREYQPPAAGRQAASRHHPDRRAADRHARVRGHAQHLHRVRADLLPEGRARLPVPAAGGSGRVRHAGVLLPLPHDRADAGDVFLPRREKAGCRASRRGSTTRASFTGFTSDSKRDSIDFATATCDALEWCLGHRLVFGSLFLAFCGGTAGSDPAARHRSVPDRGRGADSSASSRAHRHARRGNGGAVRPGRAIAAPADLQRRSGGDQRQHRVPQQRDQRDARQQRRDRHGRRRDSHLAHTRAPHHAGRLHADTPADAAARISRNGVLLPAGGHRQPGAQFRIARADRRAVDRSERRSELQTGAHAAAPLAGGARRGGRAYSAGLRPAAAEYHRRSHQGRSRSG